MTEFRHCLVESVLKISLQKGIHLAKLLCVRFLVNGTINGDSAISPNSLLQLQFIGYGIREREVDISLAREKATQPNGN